MEGRQKVGVTLIMAVPVVAGASAAGLLGGSTDGAVLASMFLFSCLLVGLAQQALP